MLRDDGVSIDLSGDRFHIGGSERAGVTEDEMQTKIEAGNKGETSGTPTQHDDRKALSNPYARRQVRDRGLRHCFDDERRSISRSALSVSLQAMFWR
jgi:hypothetical protein